MNTLYAEYCRVDRVLQRRQSTAEYVLYSVSGLSCPGAEAYLTVIFHSFLLNNKINSDYILGENIYFTPHGNFS